MDKTKILCIAASVMVVGAAAFIATSVKSANVIYDLAFENVVAMARGEATKTKQCYTAGSTGDVTTYLQCDSDTSPTETYDCPSSTTMGYKGSADKCIDK